jgi:superkiller protein 3
MQIVEALSLLLPGSSVYPALSNLPPPDLTNPVSSPSISIQAAIHNSLPTLEETVSLVEIDEAETIRKDIENRRLRLDETRSAEQLKKAIELEVLGASRVMQTLPFLSR